MDRDFEIGARKFKLNKLDAFEQMHVVRRLAPILGDLLPLAVKAQKDLKGKTVDDMSEKDLEAFAPILTGFSKLSDQDFDRVIVSLCSCVEISSGAGWARVATKNAGMMFQDLEMGELLQIAGRSLMFNLAGFFATLPQVSPKGA